MSKNSRLYGLVQSNPVARFYYQGGHTHPIRRTVLVIEDRPDRLIGYEVREGLEARHFEDAKSHVKSYLKHRIAKFGDYCRLRKNSTNRQQKPSRTTLTRSDLFDFVVNGA